MFALPDLITRYGTILRPLLRVAPVAGGVAILVWRVRETRVPVTAKSIIIPPLGMSTGLCMFFAPQMRVPLTWALTAFVAGFFLLALPLTHSTKLELRDGQVWMQRSRWFLGILLALLAVRLLLHDYIGHLISPLQTAAVFYLLALGMIVRWRGGCTRSTAGWLGWRRGLLPSGAKGRDRSGEGPERPAWGSGSLLAVAEALLKVPDGLFTVAEALLEVPNSLLRSRSDVKWLRMQCLRSRSHCNWPRFHL